MNSAKGKYASLVIVLAGVLSLVVSVTATGAAWAQEQPVSLSVESPALDLRIVEGKVEGKITRRPLYDVLEFLRERRDIAYGCPGDILRYEVSGQFDEMPLPDMIKEVLAPFNYTVALDHEGGIKRLQIISFKQPHPGAASLSPGISNKLDSPWREKVVTPADLDLSEEERRLFEVADQRVGPPPELSEQFSPSQPLGSENTGPQVPTKVLPEELPQFEMVVSETGPEGPDVVQDELPEFSPELPKASPSSDNRNY